LPLTLDNNDSEEKAKEEITMGVFGGYTRWAVVFLIIFVLFFLLVPSYSMGGAGMGAGPAIAAY